MTQILLACIPLVFIIWQEMCNAALAHVGLNKDSKTRYRVQALASTGSRLFVLQLSEWVCSISVDLENSHKLGAYYCKKSWISI